MEVAELTSHIQSLADLEKIVIVNKIGRPVVRIGWSLSLFFNEGHTLHKRLLANDAMRDFLTVFQGKITHYHPVNSERLKKIGDLDVAAYSDADAEASTGKSGRNGNDVYGANIYGFEDGREIMEPAPLYFATHGTSREIPALSYIEANFPMSWPPQSDLTALIELFVRWSSIVQPRHGTVNPGIILMQGGGSNDLVTSYPLLQRFPGLDYVNASKWTASAKKQRAAIRTIGWLTAIDDEFVETLGGRAAVATALASDEIRVHDFMGGVVIQAGPKPRLGDRNRGDVPAAYRTIARLLQPLVLDPVPMGMFYPIPASLDPEQETSKWLRRFE